MPIPATSSLVELRNLTFAYGAGNGGRVILDDISLTIPRGKVTALMGASGGGKTTVPLRGPMARLQARACRKTLASSMPLRCTPPAAAWACCFSLVRCSPI